MSTPDNIKAILTDELERVLDEVAPGEADLAGLYVSESKDFSSVADTERPYGIPGAGVAYLIGPLILAFLLSVAKAFLDEAGKQATAHIVKSLIDRLARRLKIESIAAESLKGRTETISAITSALIQAGWNAGKAGEVAEIVWKAGATAGKKMADVSND